ncbi:hypothetical protein CFH99_18810 [Nocardioides aromaticivorans]|uniref:HNH nuclease domain-containing protein n=1 Tax=Nocardioides aromaticivorans TaxID=200618 RepID=A0ABX7PNW4_9ACTN|nr:HNH endonuclease signature motif containing protein [Nocardioides aromaticivorans]QSR27678.1 hypothetical protein CFH99_18810 [Nocardioides aromaticivorans]
MDLGTSGTATAVSTASLLSWIADDAEVRDHLLIREWMNIVAWAEANIVDSPEGAATLTEGYLDTGVPIAGPGAPLVSEFQLMELIAVLGRSPDGGRSYVGQVIECAWRLPLLYAAVLDGRVAPWRAQRIADLTRSLQAAASGFVDRHLNAAVGGVGWAQLERLVTEAILRFDPERAEHERQKANDRRHCDIGMDEVDAHGGVHLDAYLDAADGHDFNQAVAREAHLRGQLGDTDSLDVRRAKAVGAIARRDLALDLLIADETTGEVIAQAPGRRVELSVHITDTALAAQAQGSRDGRCATSSTTSGNNVGRWDEGRCPVTTAQIREWLQVPGTAVIVRPVIDLADCVPVDSYEIPDRHQRRVRLRDHTCRFPNCPQQAVRCDLDHAQPHGEGGKTRPCNLVPLCRRHHRSKTHSQWRYLVIQPGHYLWTSPHGQHFHVGPAGTTILDGY